MKPLFGLMGATLLIGILSTIVFKVREGPLIAVAAIGIAMAVVDLWQARNEANTRAMGWMATGPEGPTPCRLSAGSPTRGSIGHA